MKTTVSNTLAGFKHMIESAKNNGIFVKTIIYNAKNEVVRESAFRPVTKSQSNSFALESINGDSWVEYGKASAWKFDFDNNKAIRVNPAGNMEIQFSDINFFGY